MITCSVCNAQNQTGALFCEMCGSRLAVAAPASAAAPASVPVATPAAAVSAPTAAATSGAVGGLQCPTCGHTALPGEAFCDECGTPLAAPVGNPAQAAAQPTPPAQPAPQAAYPPPTPIANAATNVCPSCGTPAIAGEAFCDNCGASLLGAAVGVQGSGANAAPPLQAAPAPVAQPAAPVPAAQPAAPPPATPPMQAAPAPQPSRPPTPDPRSLTLANYVLKLANGVIIALPAKAEAVIGREDAPSNNYPEVDLGPHNALAEGVGRRHARLTLQNGQVHIEDLDSTNGTFLNKQRVVARQPVALAVGAELRLGKIAMTFQHRDATP